MISNECKSIVMKFCLFFRNVVLLGQCGFILYAFTWKYVAVTETTLDVGLDTPTLNVTSPCKPRIGATYVSPEHTGRKLYINSYYFSFSIGFSKQCTGDCIRTRFGILFETLFATFLAKITKLIIIKD